MQTLVQFNDMMMHKVMLALYIIFFSPGDFFKAELKGEQNIIEVKMDSKTFLICGNDWNIEAANVACRRMQNSNKYV